MITTAPLPRWADLRPLLFGSEEASGAPWCGEGDGALWFSRGAWALHALSRWWTNAKGGPPTVWIPDFFCNQSLDPLRRSGAKLVFYPIALSLQPKWDACRRLAASCRPDFFLLAHYFGHPGDVRSAQGFCAEIGAYLIEDGAHVLKPALGVGSAGDFAFYSPHKLLPVPDGAVLVIKKPRILAEMAQTAARMTDAAPPSGPWAARRIAQKLVPAAVMRRLRPPPETPFETDPPGAETPDTPRMSRAARRMLGRLAGQLDRIARHRRAADQAVRDALSRQPGWSALNRDWGEATPYRTVMRCDDAKTAADRFAQIRRRGGLVESWPDLPPETQAEPLIHAEAIRLRRTLLLFALDNAAEPLAQAAAWAERI